MSTQNEFPTFRLLLKQVYTAYSSKVKELENEIKVLKEKLELKERENSLSECTRCIELEEAFKSCKKALLDQSKLFENFGQKFSIFSSPSLENNDVKSVAKSSNSKEKLQNSRILKNESTAFDENDQSRISLGESTITESKIDCAEKLSFSSNNHNIFKKVMNDEENLESMDACTITFPQCLKQGSKTAKFDSLILAPDSLDTTPETKKISKINSRDNKGEEHRCKTSNSDEHKNSKPNEKCQESKGPGKRLSSDSLDDDRVKRYNDGKQVENNSKFARPKEVRTCSANLPEKSVADAVPENVKQDNLKMPVTTVSDLNLKTQSVQLSKKKSVLSATVETKENKTDTPKNISALSAFKNKISPKETSPSLLPTNAVAPLKMIDIANLSNDDDFQEHIPSSKTAQNEDSWDTCDKKKSSKINKAVKAIKCSSKFKMTLVAPPPNYKKPSFKQTKLSKSLFKAKDSNSTEKQTSSKDDNPVIIEEESPTVLQEQFQTSTPYDDNRSPFTVDIDATFIPDNFQNESPKFATTSVKKNAVGKSHLKNGNLFSNISFPGELDVAKTENPHDDDGIENQSPDEDFDLKENMNSFDRLPLPEEPNYKYKNDVVRKKSERKQLNGFDCKECEKYYSELGLSDKEKKERMKKCSRHRGKYTPPSTPDHFWELEFPDTQECKARGYLNETQKVKLKNLCNI